MRTRVVVADDHQIVREGLVRFLESSAPIEVVQQASSLAQLLGLDLSAVDVLVLDLNFSDGMSVDSVAMLIERYPDIKILIFSMYNEPDVVLRALRRGARGFVDKNEPATAVRSAIDVLMNGGRRLPEFLREFIVAQQIDLQRESHEDLSDREREVFLLIAQGKRPTDISRELGLSVNTVSVYVHRIKQKLGVETLGQIVAYAHRLAASKNSPVRSLL